MFSASVRTRHKAIGKDLSPAAEQPVDWLSRLPGSQGQLFAELVAPGYVALFALTLHWAGMRSSPAALAEPAPAELAAAAVLVALHLDSPALQAGYCPVAPDKTGHKVTSSLHRGSAQIYSAAG